MKNIFLALLITALILCAIPFSAHAEEAVVDEVVTEPTDTPTEEVETPTDTPTETPEETPITNDIDEVATFITRIKEAWENGDVTLVVSLSLEVAVLVLMIIVKKSGSKNAGVYVDKSRELAKGFNSVVDATNDIVKCIEGEDGLKKMLKDETTKLTDSVQESLTAIKELDKEKLLEYGKQLTATTHAVKCLAEMLQQVYANSTTIPMSVKGVINEKYVEICRDLNTENGGDKNA